MVLMVVMICGKNNAFDRISNNWLEYFFIRYICCGYIYELFFSLLYFMDIRVWTHVLHSYSFICTES